MTKIAACRVSVDNNLYGKRGIISVRCVGRSVIVVEGAEKLAVGTGADTLGVTEVAMTGLVVIPGTVVVTVVREGGAAGVGVGAGKETTNVDNLESNCLNPSLKLVVIVVPSCWKQVDMNACPIAS